MIKNLEVDSSKALKWFGENFMKLNADKCHFLLHGNTGDWINSVKIGNETILETEEERLLGILIDKDLKFDGHISNICKKVGNKISILAKLARYLESSKKCLLLKIFIESQFSYCPLIWMFCSRKMNRRINFLHERALRIAYNDRDSTFEELLRKNNTMKIHHKNIQKVAIEMYKVHRKLCPDFVSDLFSIHTGPSTRSGREFDRPTIETVFKGELSFRNFGPIVWNEMLPYEYKNLASLEIFKQNIKQWIPDNCHCRLCKDYVQGVGFINVI